MARSGSAPARLARSVQSPAFPAATTTTAKDDSGASSSARSPTRERPIAAGGPLRNLSQLDSRGGRAPSAAPAAANQPSHGVKGAVGAGPPRGKSADRDHGGRPWLADPEPPPRALAHSRPHGPGQRGRDPLRPGLENPPCLPDGANIGPGDWRCERIQRQPAPLPLVVFGHCTHRLMLGSGDAHGKLSG